MSTRDETSAQQRSRDKTWQRTARNVRQVTKAMRELSSISAVLWQRSQRSGRHLRSVLDFDEINRLNMPLKGKKSAKRRRSARRSARRGSYARGGWNLSGALGGLRGLGRVLGLVWKRLKEFFQSRKWTIPKHFSELSKAAGALGKQLSGALGWGWEHILKPLAKWGIDEAVPAALGALGAALGTVGKACELLSGVGKAVWDGVLAPLAGYTADLAVGALNALEHVFENLSGSLDLLMGLKPLEWLKTQFIDPLNRMDPLVFLKVDWLQGPKELWNSFRDSWADNPSIQQLVSLTRDGWTSVKDWVKKYLGGGLSKAVGLAQDGWTNVKDWVKKHLGGNVSKAVGLVQDGWSSVSGWVKGSLGKGVSCTVGLLKGWKGTVVKALGLDKLSAKFQIKLPKVEITWSKGKIPLPSFHLKWNAQGGILDAPTLFGASGSTLLGGGEAGREAILPLERNTGWMDGLADRLAQRMGTQEPVCVQVVLDGRVVAESTVRQLRGLARQGRFPLSGLV